MSLAVIYLPHNPKQEIYKGPKGFWLQRGSRTCAARGVHDSHLDTLNGTERQELTRIIGHMADLDKVTSERLNLNVHSVQSHNFGCFIRSQKF